jgi:hypothetical protein
MTSSFPRKRESITTDRASIAPTVIMGPRFRGDDANNPYGIGNSGFWPSGNCMSNAVSSAAVAA